MEGSPITAMVLTSPAVLVDQTSPLPVSQSNNGVCHYRTSQ